MSIHLTATATLHPLVLPARADAAPTNEIRTYADVRNRSILETTGREDDFLSADELLPVLYSSRASQKRQWYVTEAGEMIGCVAVDMLQDADADTSIATVALLRSNWGKGIGTAALAALETELRAAGMRTVLCWVQHQDDGTEYLQAPTGFGAIPRDHTAEFLDRRGFTLVQVERASEFVWAEDTLPRLLASLASAQEHASDYRVVQWLLPTPAEFIDGYAWMKSRMSTDAPDAELNSPEEIWDAARVGELEQRQAAKGFVIQVTAAQHIATGELCAFNELAIRQSDTGSTSHQYDTLVLAGHRGHRLGMLVKAAGLIGWHEKFPESPRVITYNAEENRPMLDINEAIGFTPISYEGAWKKNLT